MGVPVQPPPPGVLSDFSKPEDLGRRSMFIATSVACIFLSTLAFVARMYARTRVPVKVGWDDALASVALALNAALMVSFIKQWNCGLVFIAWNVELDDFMESHYNAWIYWNSIFTLLLYIIFPIIKLSILALYLRILGPFNKMYLIGVWVLICFVIVTLVATVTAVVKMCDPPKALFYPWIEAKCNISVITFIIQAALMVLTDLFCLLAPVPFVWGLQMSSQRKMEVLLPILIGLFVTVIGVVRMILLIQQLWAPNYAIDLESWQGTYLAIIEINCALIAACLPAAKPFFNSAYDAASKIRSRISRSYSNGRASNVRRHSRDIRLHTGNLMRVPSGDSGASGLL